MKTIASFLTAALFALGALVVASPAQAAYPKSISTVCSATAVKSPIGNFTRPRLAFSARPTAGNGEPSGSVRVQFIKNGVVKRTAFRAYTGGTAVYSFKRFRRDGTYTVVATLTTPAASVYKGCSDDAIQVIH